MADMKHTLTFDKLRYSAALVDKVRDWAKSHGLCREDASVVKVIGTKAQIDDLEAIVKAEGEKAKPRI
ncbi:MAG: hypothetical protein O7H41_05565 [Planctomycetota bacterium]|nr:hypothetical protein [Planctomycetota bacterium]